MGSDAVTMLGGACSNGDLRDVAQETTRQFVTFQVSGETFAVGLTDVQEIIRLPDLVSVPLSPPSLVGLANLRGAVLPVASLRRIFGLKDTAHDDASRVLVVNDGLTIGFIVDRVARVMSAEAAEIEAPETISPDIPKEMVSGMIKKDGKIIMVISPRSLVEAEFKHGATTLRAAIAGTKSVTLGGATETNDADADEVQLVSFVVDGQEYAFPIENVQEIVTVPSEISRVPNAPPEVMGVITLRERLLALVSLRAIFGLPSPEAAEQSRIVVVSIPGPAGERITVGVVMDTVKEVLRIHRTAIDRVPPVVGQHTGEDIAGICRLSGGKRLVSIISAERLFGGLATTLRAGEIAEALRSASPANDDLSDEENAVIHLASKSEPRREDDEEELFVVLKLAGGEYGVPINAVQEIVRVPEDLTVIPQTPSFIEGVVNLRGAVLPVVDKRARLGLSRIPRNDRQRIMVLILNGRQTGFIVDSVTEVLKVPTSRIRAAPELSEEQARLITRVVNLEDDKRVILLIEVSRLLDGMEISALIAKAA